MIDGFADDPSERPSMTAPLSVLELDVAPDWIDYNGHMNDAYYAVAFSRAGDAFLDWLGFDAIERAATKRSTFTLSLVIRYVAEAKLGERIALSVQVPSENLLVYFIFNAYWEPLDFEIPPLENGSENFWHRWVDTYLDSPQDIVAWDTAPAMLSPTYRTGARSVVVLWAKNTNYSS